MQRRRSWRPLFHSRSAASTQQTLPRSKRPILDRYMYNGHLNPRSPSSPALIRPPERKRNEGNRCRMQIAPLSPPLNCSCGRSEKNTCWNCQLREQKQHWAFNGLLLDRRKQEK
jgi:hypothetical protein